MENQPLSPTSHGRKRYLNIVYFIESARSHTIRINLTHARWAFGLLAIAMAWSIGSIAWIWAINSQLSSTRSRLERALTTVFEYQIRNDKVFEIAYPTEATRSYYSESATLPANNPTDEPKPSAAQTEVKVVALSPDAKTAATPEADLRPANGGAPDDFVSISNSSIKTDGGKVSLHFDINNRGRGKADGYIWAVAALKDSTGKETHYGAPSHVQIDSATGTVKSANTGYRFSIQRYKNKVFDFNIPIARKSDIAQIVIHYTDLKGHRESLVKIGVDPRQSSSPDTDTETDQAPPTH